MKYRLYRAKSRGGKVLPKWKAKFFTSQGQYIKAETLYTDKGKSRDRAEEICRGLEQREAEKAAGIPQTSTRPIGEIIEEYIQVKGQKGKDGRPWCEAHLVANRVKLKFWVDVLGLKTLQDINLIGVEKALAGMPYSATTRNRYFFFLAALVNWAVKVRLMPYNPLQGFQLFKGEPAFVRAAFTVAELRALFDVTPPVRRVSYQLAILTGMRLMELRSLRVCDLDRETRVIKLSAAAAKNRREAWFYVPEDFLRDLLPTLEGKGPQDPLLDLYKRGAERLREDMARAGLAWHTPRGVLDFHSLRATFATLLNEYGEDPKAIQDLMRHSSPIMTMARYTKTNEARKRLSIENLARMVPGQARERQGKENTEGTREGKSARG